MYRGSKLWGENMRWGLLWCKVTACSLLPVELYCWHFHGETQLVTMLEIGQRDGWEGSRAQHTAQFSAGISVGITFQLGYSSTTENRQTKLMFYLVETIEDNSPPSRSQAVKSWLVREKESTAQEEGRAQPLNENLPCGGINKYHVPSILLPDPWVCGDS